MQGSKAVREIAKKEKRLRKSYSNDLITALSKLYEVILRNFINFSQKCQSLQKPCALREIFETAILQNLTFQTFRKFNK